MKLCEITFILFLSYLVAPSKASLPDEGKWDYNLTSENSNLILSKSLFKGSQVFVQVNCESPGSEITNITISWAIVKSVCWDFTEAVEKMHEYLSKSIDILDKTNNSFRSIEKQYRCNDHIVLEEKLQDDAVSLKILHPLYVIPSDGVYVFAVTVSGTSSFNLNMHIEMKSEFGYLSAADWPLLPFYGLMCIFYVILGIIWLVLASMQWRDLIRVQFWIGAVIFLGMLEKATFYAEYHAINSTGSRVQGAMLCAEWVSCAKRTLARMLVVIVSLGFGIVRPRLGAALHRVTGVGLLYFFLAASEAYLRVTRAKNDQSKDLLVAAVPLAVLDSAICWWIFNALVNTTRTLRLRRNEVKLTLYRHFTNTLIFSVAASVIFMLYSIKTHRIVACLQIWKDLWVEEAFWHILFSALLLVIMVLWRPTNNNQRYAFVPLLDNGDDDDEEQEQLVHDAYGVKVRFHNNQKSDKNFSKNTVEEDLKWLEENVTADSTLPVLDSDEELVNTRFEVSKMQ